MKILRSRRARQSSRFTSLIVAIGMLALLVAPSAGAQTVAELQAQIAALLAQINTLQAQLGGLQGGSTANCGFTRSLHVGVSSGADVQCLQQYLNGAGFTVAASGAGSAGAETTFFGSLTQGAVARWQAANSVSPAVGYFGPISQAKYNALIAASPGTPSTPGTPAGLSGGAGAIEDADYISSLNNEEVGEGENDAEVAGLELEASDESDIEITAVNLNFSQSTGATEDFEKYADEVSVWLDGVELARVDADEFEDNDNFDQNVSLAAGGIIRAGQTGDLVVAVSGINNLDSSDAGDTWTLEFESVRFRDGQNAVISDTTTGDINDGAGRSFTFETFATASNTELKFKAGDDAINDARVINVDATNDTDNVTIFSFMIEVEGDSDVVLDDLPVNYTAVGANVDEVISSAELWIDGAQVDTINMPSTATTTIQAVFDDFDYTLSAGEEVEAQIRGDFQDLAGTLAEGDTILVSIGEGETDDADFDAEDEEGNNLTDAEVTGAATTEAHVVYDVAFQVSLVSTNAEVTAGDAQGGSADVAEFTVVWDVTAFDGDIFIGTSTDEDATAAAEEGASYDATSATSTASLTCSGCDTDGTTGAFQVDEGTTERFTLTVASLGNANSGSFHEIQLAGIGWATDATADANTFTFGIDDYDAGPVFVRSY